jgi:hypothetical protein
LAGWLSPLLDQRPEIWPSRQRSATSWGAKASCMRLRAGGWKKCGTRCEKTRKYATGAELWPQRLGLLVYGTSIEDDVLFIQHTYLTLVAKTMATLMLGIIAPRAPPICWLEGRVANNGIPL